MNNPTFTADQPTTITELLAENERLRAELAYANQYDTPDELTPLIGSIVRTPDYWKTYGKAIVYVSNRYSKSSLVHLVTYLFRQSEAKSQSVVLTSGVAKAACERLRAFLIQHANRTGVDPEMIMSLNMGTPDAAELLASDLEIVLGAVRFVK